jgi:2-dehydro-3-deoxyphosphogluconate aldolase / (4S)-4-hydroxy-2-oxoglutarate aldolase
MTHSAAIDKFLRLSPVMPVVTVSDPTTAADVARALVRGGIRVIEVTLRTPVALRAIELIAREVPEITVGAGTVLSPSLPVRPLRCSMQAPTARSRICPRSRPHRS